MNASTTVCSGDSPDCTRIGGHVVRLESASVVIHGMTHLPQVDAAQKKE